MPQSIYTRGKNEQGKWRYSRIETGKGRKTSQLEPPFFVRPFRNGKQVWHALGAQTFRDAETEATQVGVGLEAQAQGLTVAELDNNPNRITLAKAIEKFIKNAEASKKHRTVNGYKLNLSNFVESASAAGIKFLDQINGDTIREFRDFLREDGIRDSNAAQPSHHRYLHAEKEWHQDRFFNGRRSSAIPGRDRTAVQRRHVEEAIRCDG